MTSSTGPGLQGTSYRTGSKFMFARVSSAAVLGVDGYIVSVEIDLSYNLPTFTTVGLPEGAVRESKERVTSAIKNSGYAFPQKRITVNLATGRHP